MSILFAYIAGGEVGGRSSEVLKWFVRGDQNFFYLLSVCVWGGRFSTSPSVKKINDPLLLINDGSYNKKSQWSLRRLSFFKILLVTVYNILNIMYSILRKKHFDTVSEG